MIYFINECTTHRHWRTPEGTTSPASVMRLFEETKMLRIFRRADALPETNPGQEAVFVIVSNGWTTKKFWSISGSFHFSA